MIIIQINQPGFVLKIPGKAEMRTPVKFEIGKMRVETILDMLRVKGISDFTITSTSQDIKNTRLEIEKEDKPIKSNKLDISKLDLDELAEKLANKILTNIGHNSYIKTDAIGKEYKEKEAETLNEFIPTIDSNLFSNSELSINSFSGIDSGELLENVKKLRRLKK